MPKVINVNVTTPEARVEFQIQYNSTGKQLFDQVAKTLGLRETWYFGIQYQDKEDQANWLKLDRKLSDQSIKKEETFSFLFLVKFYPEDVSTELILPITQRLFYLQVKKAIVYGDIYCAPERLLLLASYQAVDRFGCYNPEVHKPGFLNVKNFIPTRILEQHELSYDKWEDKIVAWYKKHTDLSREDAMMEYLKIAQDLEMYGMSYFPIKNKKKTDLWLGVDSMGLNVYPADDKLTPSIGFPWSEVRNISYSDKKVSIKPTDKSAKDFTFTVDRVSTSKKILTLCVGNHDLYARRRKPDSIEVQQMKEEARQTKETKENERLRFKEAVAAREAAEAKLREVLAENEEQQRRVEEEMQEMQHRTRMLESQLEQEKAAREELEQMQCQLEEVNKQLSEESANTADEKARLQEERDNIRLEIERQKKELAAKEEEKQIAEARVAELQRAKEKETKPIIKNVVHADNGHSQHQTNHVGNGDCNGARASGDNDSGAHDFEDMDNADRREESRTVYTQGEDYNAQLTKLKKELNEARNQNKIAAVDVRYEQNQSKGMDKFKTLRQIRQGNTKRRVDEFEAL